LFLGACDAHGKPKDGLDITKHVPLGLELFGHVNSPLAERNLAYLCEDLTVGILYDCDNRIPLYAATVIRGSQFSKARGRRPRSQKFILSKSGLDKYFQQSTEDYKDPLNQKICYKTRSGKEIVDVDWYKAKSSNKSPPHKVCTGVGSNDLKTKLRRGHLVASQYGVGDQSLNTERAFKRSAVCALSETRHLHRVNNSKTIDMPSQVKQQKQEVKMHVYKVRYLSKFFFCRCHSCCLR